MAAGGVGGANGAGGAGGAGAANGTTTDTAKNDGGGGGGGGGLNAEEILGAQQDSIDRAIKISLKASTAKTLGDALIGAASKA